MQKKLPFVLGGIIATAVCGVAIVSILKKQNDKLIDDLIKRNEDEVFGDGFCDCSGCNEWGRCCSCKHFNSPEHEEDTNRRYHDDTEGNWLNDDVLTPDTDTISWKEFNVHELEQNLNNKTSNEDE